MTNPKDAIGDRKPQLHLIPASALILEAEVMALGAAKYGPFNWRDSPIRGTVYVSAVLRHIAQWIDGEDCDSESGISHLAHVRANMGIMIDALLTGNLIDDRPSPGVSADLITALTRGTDDAK